MSKYPNDSGDVIIEEKSADSDDIIVRRIENEEPKRFSDFDFASSVKDVAQKTGDVIKGATESIGKAIESALSARDHVVMVRVNDDSLKKLESLVQSGIFKSRSEAAAFLIVEGVKAQEALFNRIEDKISEIERLRNELRDSIKTQENG
jgi:hypothetical protein